MIVLDKCKKKEDLRIRFPENRKTYISSYDYEDDSDLEEDDDEPEISPQVTMDKSVIGSSGLFAIEKSDAKNSDSSEVISVSDLDSCSQNHQI